MSVDEERRKKEGMNLIKVHYMHAWKYHSENPLYLYALIKMSLD
jgi:hypothetical protein